MMGSDAAAAVAPLQIVLIADVLPFMQLRKCICSSLADCVCDLMLKEFWHQRKRLGRIILCVA